jgi:hypothetical protein
VQIVTFELPRGKTISIRIPQSVSPAVAFFGLNRDLPIDQAITALKQAYPALANGSQAANAKVANLRKHYDRYYNQHTSTHGPGRASVVSLADNDAPCASSAYAAASVALRGLTKAQHDRKVRDEALVIVGGVQKFNQAIFSAQRSFHAYVKCQMHCCLLVHFS